MVYLFFTGGSGNRGCEAIVRGTKEILVGEKMIVYTANLEEEKESGLESVVECRKLTQAKSGLAKKWSYLLCGLSFHFGNCKLQVKQIYKDFLKSIKKGDTYLVIGGDVYCYDEPKIYYRVNEILKNNRKILWGCSIEPDSIDSNMKKNLLGYNLIYARESITYQGLIEHGIKNVKLYPDPAFAMKAVKAELPDGFAEGNTIGINVSPLIIAKEKAPGITINNYIKLIQYILEHTNCPIALVPHVIWKNNDDRKPLTELLNAFHGNNRIIMVKAYPAEKIKYIISKCRFLVAARTHASIAAYSTCVPTLVTGYSVKAKGIAKDLFGVYEDYIIPVQALKKEDDLLNKFLWMWNREDEIRKHLMEFMPKYKEGLKYIRENVLNM